MYAKTLQIQSIERVRGKGLGKFLMQTLELIGVRAGMQKIMVTVFKHNQRAVHFFMEILKYVCLNLLLVCLLF